MRAVERGAKILVVDIGNTNIVAGFFDGLTIRHVLREKSDRGMDVKACAAVIGRLGIDSLDGGIVSSVVPELTGLVEEAIRTLLPDAEKIIRVSPDLDLGIRIGVDAPDRLGPDRIVNAAYGFDRFGGPLLVIDFGTATSMTAVTADGVLAGGAILPGLRTSLLSLTSLASLLSPVSLDGPIPQLGKNTEDAMRLGVVEGHAGAVRRVADGIIGALGGSVKVVATGGLAGYVSGRTGIVDYNEPDLMLLGLRYLWERNTGYRHT